MRHLSTATRTGFAIALIALAGCNGNDDEGSKTTAAEPPPAQRSADPRVVKRIPFKSTPEQVVAQIGRPARIEREKSKTKTGATCYIYRVTGGRPTERIRMCFVAGKLLTVITLTKKQ